MTKPSVIVPLLLALLVASAACVPASGEVPTAYYPTTGSPAYSVASNTATYTPTAVQTPDRTYAAWPQANYGSYPPAAQQQVACYSAPCAAAGCDTGDCGGQPNPYATPADCGYSSASCMPCQPEAVWTASVDGLLMSINESHHHFFSYDDANEEDQYTDWRNVNIEWGGGFEVALRRFSACSCTGWEAVYWGLFPGAQETYTYGANLAPGNLNGINNWDQLDYNGDTADTWVNNALVHRLRRDVEIHNAEINHVMLSGDGCATPFRGEVLCGLRFFRFSDDLQFSADTVDTVFSGADEELYYDMDMDNTLVGAQVGGWGEYTLGCRLSVAAGAKVGVYNNHIKSYQHIGGAAGTATINNGPNLDRGWLVDASKDDISLLGELQLQLLYQITPCWRAELGYRVVGVTGIATPTDQIYPDLRGLQDVELVDSHGSLFLHGFSASVERQF